MSVDPALVSRLPMFARVPPSAVRSSLPMWRERRMSGGEGLWPEGGPGDEVGVVLAGELSARHGGVEVNRFGQGELVGEGASFFAGATRSASVVAASPAHLLLLSREGLARLRAWESPVYDAILDQALRTMVARVARLNDRLTRKVEGAVPAPRRKEPSALVRLWRSFVPGAPPPPPPKVETLLRGLPGLEDVPPDALAHLEGAFVADALEEGQVLFLEYEEADAAYIVAEGEIDVLRNVGGERAERLGVCKPGDLLGVNALVSRDRRTASCVATKPTWLYRISFDACRALPPPAKRLWWECMLSSVATQLRLSTAQLSTALRDQATIPGLPRGAAAASPAGKNTPRPQGKDDLQTILAASGFLERLPADTDELSKVSFVVDDDQRRHPRRSR